MIIVEPYLVREDGVALKRTYSDEGRLIQKVGTEEIYCEAIDIETAPWTYVETEEYIDPPEEMREVVEEPQEPEEAPMEEM